MTEETFLALLRSIRPEMESSVLDLPVEDTTLDSFDLLQLRSGLEAGGALVDDRAWLDARTLRALLKALG